MSAASPGPPPGWVPSCSPAAPSSGSPATGAEWRIAGARGAIVAPKVLLATGAYTDRLWPGLARTFVGVQSAQMATAPLSANVRASVLPCRAVVSDTRKLSNYFRIDAEGRLVMGGRGPLGDTPSPSTLAAIARAAERRFPCSAASSGSMPGAAAST